ncbi:unnamed protein product [Caenorhabditis brenneri]
MPFFQPPTPPNSPTKQAGPLFDGPPPEQNLHSCGGDSGLGPSYVFKKLRGDPKKQCREKLYHTGTTLVGQVSPPFGWLAIPSKPDLKWTKERAVGHDMNELFYYRKDARVFNIWTRIPECKGCRLESDMTEADDYVIRTICGMTKDITDGVYSLYRQADYRLIRKTEQDYFVKSSKHLTDKEYFDRQFGLPIYPLHEQVVPQVHLSSLVWRMKDDPIIRKIEPFKEKPKEPKCLCRGCKILYDNYLKRHRLRKLSHEEKEKLYADSLRNLKPVSKKPAEVDILPFARPSTPCTMNLVTSLRIKRRALPLLIKLRGVKMPHYPKYRVISLRRLISLRWKKAKKDQKDMPKVRMNYTTRYQLFEEETETVDSHSEQHVTENLQLQQAGPQRHQVGLQRHQVNLHRHQVGLRRIQVGLRRLKVGLRRLQVALDGPSILVNRMPIRKPPQVIYLGKETKKRRKAQSPPVQASHDMKTSPKPSIHASPVVLKDSESAEMTEKVEQVKRKSMDEKKAKNPDETVQARRKTLNVEYASRKAGKPTEEYKKAIGSRKANVTGMKTIENSGAKPPRTSIGNKKPDQLTQSKATEKLAVKTGKNSTEFKSGPKNPVDKKVNESSAAKVPRKSIGIKTSEQLAQSTATEKLAVETGKKSTDFEKGSENPADKKAAEESEPKLHRNSNEFKEKLGNPDDKKAIENSAAKPPRKSFGIKKTDQLAQSKATEKLTVKTGKKSTDFVKGSENPADKKAAEESEPKLHRNSNEFKEELGNPDDKKAAKKSEVKIGENVKVGEGARRTEPRKSDIKEKSALKTKTAEVRPPWKYSYSSK